MSTNTNKLISLKIKHLPINQRSKFFLIVKESNEIYENLLILKTEDEVTNYAMKVIRENEKSLHKLINDHRKDLKDLKNKQDIILMEESISNQAE